MRRLAPVASHAAEVATIILECVGQSYTSPGSDEWYVAHPTAVIVVVCYYN